ncbi:M48 family metallopeptidase [Exiguobacterium aurantiacum]|uniref:M48 family metalloprotease n=1 Tax=Exiguobacterium aurantiacum TaxID=33987 RepID=A0ABY5FLL5_9BACL|nr:M48 family metallopeptidase [Exiguobacterium aurantiacum]UTT42370.1 M48 family metalloprotease [Exiguobacterium aurantiacum]
MKQSQLVHKNEKLYFGLLVAASVLTIILGIVFTIASLGIFLWIIGTILALSLFTHWLQIGYIRTNGVKVTERQFADLYQTYQRVGQEMGIRLLPDVYILQAGGVLNAFATRFFQKNMVILYSDIVELSRDGYTKEVEFVIAHELAHIRRNHVQKQWAMMLGGWIPFLGSAYSRACEFTCDRMAAHHIQDQSASKRALTILAIGGKLAKEVSEFDYLYEASRENGFIAKLSELLSTHPPLPKRIAAIATNAGETNVPVFKTAGYVKGSIIGTIVLSVIVNVAIVAWLFTSDGLTGFSEGFGSLDAMAEEPIQELAYNAATYEEFEALLADGADVNTQDLYGDTPLHNLLYNEGVDIDTVGLLLENGADVSLENEDGMTPAELAADSGQPTGIIELIQSYE